MERTAIILAGGNSLRMGEDKGLMLVNGKPMIEHIIDTVKGVVEEIIIISNNEEYDRFGYPVYPDQIKGKGPLGGIYTGLLHSKTQLSLVLSCDIPYVNDNLLNLLISHSEGYDVTIPQKDGVTHQLMGVFSKRCLITFKNAIDDNDLKLKTLFEKLNLNIVDASQFSGRLFTNVNQKDDIEV
jgi:molybdenum cofactor guanylyltransferase